MLLGALMSEPVVMYMGQIQIALLGVAFMLLVPGALALDRRRVTLQIEENDERKKGAHLVGDILDEILVVINHSPVTLHALRAIPFGSQAIRAEAAEPRRFLPGSSSLKTRFSIALPRSGRWMLHGFDVCISDPLGLLETRDYLPCPKPIEVYPKRRAVQTPPSS